MLNIKVLLSAVLALIIYLQVKNSSSDLGSLKNRLERYKEFIVNIKNSFFMELLGAK